MGYCDTKNIATQFDVVVPWEAGDESRILLCYYFNLLFLLSYFLQSFIALWLQPFRKSGKFATLSQRLDIFFAQFPLICIR